MSIAALIRRLGKAGATPEVIAMAVEAIESIENQHAAEEQKLLRKEQARQRKIKQRRVTSRDSGVTCVGQERDTIVDNQYVTNGSSVTSRDSGVTCDLPPILPLPPLDVPPSLLPAPSSLPPLNPPLPPPTPEKPTPVGVVKKTNSPRKLASRLSVDFMPPDAWRDFAAEKGLESKEAGAAWHAFRDHHLAKATLFVDWDAAWRMWVRNAVKFEAERQRRTKNG